MEERNSFREVEFLCHSPDAKRVSLVGDFNDWSADDIIMAKNRSGDWRTEVPLKPGHYEYKYVVDGNWVCDPGCARCPHKHCPACVTNPFGTMNRVIEVK